MVVVVDLFGVVWHLELLSYVSELRACSTTYIYYEQRVNREKNMGKNTEKKLFIHRHAPI